MEVQQGPLAEDLGFSQGCQGRSWCSNDWILPALHCHAAFLECRPSKPELGCSFCSQHFCYDGCAARARWVAWKPCKVFCKQL